jgi:HD-GYP domain-containing protein (c-di-GMP phosphodiesterase class II)
MKQYNGSGDPNGRTRANISLEARIVAVADVFDALGTRTK